MHHDLAEIVVAVLGRTALVGLYAALMFLLALCSKFNLAKHSTAARAEVERRRRG